MEAGDAVPDHDRGILSGSRRAGAVAADRMRRRLSRLQRSWQHSRQWGSTSWRKRCCRRWLACGHRLPHVHGSTVARDRLERFLENALDKWDGRYANPTYLGLNLLPLPTLTDDLTQIAAIERQYDRLLVQLVADAARFEIAAFDGETSFLPDLRPDERTTAKRCRLALQIALPAARRLGLDEGAEADDALAAARCLWANVEQQLSEAERLTLRLTMLPVSLQHDEYQFIRILQAFEATFALAAVEMHAAVRALGSGQIAFATERITVAERALHEAAPLFSLVATMRIEAFHTFREFTEGASAIQSRNYKLMESLCREPDPARRDAPAYTSAPEVRQRVLSGQETLDAAFLAATTSGQHDSAEIAALEQAMQRFAATLRRWRRTHHGIAVRMLGERTGTGYTEGAAYLHAVQAIPVFTTVGHEDAGSEAAVGTLVQAVPAVAPRGRCPFAAGRAAWSGAIIR